MKNINLKKRISLVILALAIQAIYVPTSHYLTGGIEPKLPIDIFPLWKIWVIPYLLCYPIWALGIGWLIWKSEDGLFRTAVAGLFLTFSIGILVFILFPTYINQPEITGSDFISQVMRFVQVAGGDHDALPSGHIYTTVILAFIYSRWHPRFNWLWLLIVVLVSLSTLFTQQHYIADVFAGYLTGWLGYRFGLWWNTMDGTTNKET